MAGELNHIGFIADGNRRWARARNLPTLEGHRRGFDVVQDIVEFYKNSEVKYLSFFVFSTENWDRSEEEVSYLMKLISNSIEQLAKKAQKDHLRIVLMGRPEPVEPKLWEKLQKIEADTKANDGLTVCFCCNYGGQWEIADAAQAIVDEITQNGNEDMPTITPEVFAKYLYHPEIPPLDFVVRTSGEQRISGFQLWRSAYAEFWFIDKNFPDVNTEDCQEALEEFHRRGRRFGK